MPRLCIFVLFFVPLIISGCRQSPYNDASCAHDLTYQANTLTTGEGGIYNGTGYFADLFLRGEKEEVAAKVSTADNFLTLKASVFAGEKGKNDFIHSFGSQLLVAKEARDNFDITCQDSLSLDFALAQDSKVNMPHILGLSASKDPLSFFNQLENKYHYPNLFSLSLCRFGGGKLILGGFDKKIGITKTLPLFDGEGFFTSVKKIRRKDNKKVIASFGSPSHEKALLDSSSSFVIFPTDVATKITQEITNEAEKIGIIDAFPRNFFSLQRGAVTKTIYFANDKQIRQFPAFEIEFYDFLEKKHKTLELEPDYYFKQVDKTKPLARIFAIRQTEGQTVLGQPFMENHYMVFDKKNNLLSFGDIEKACQN